MGKFSLFGSNSEKAKENKAEWINIAGLSIVYVAMSDIFLHTQYLQYVLNPAWYQVLGAALAGGGLYRLLRKKGNSDLELVDNVLLHSPLSYKENGEDIPPKLLDDYKIKGGCELVYQLPFGKTLNDFLKLRDAFSQQLNKDVDIELRNRAIHLTIWDEDLPDNIHYKTPDLSKYKLGVVLGENRKGLFAIDLVKKFHHILNGAATGWGKSTWIRSVVVSILQNYTEEQVQLHWVDLKRVEAGLFKGCKRVNCYFERDDALKLLNGLKKEMNRRNKFLDKMGYTKMENYNDESPREKRLPYVLLIMEEYSDLADDDQINDIVIELGRKARSTGIHMIFSMQRTVRDCLPANLKANLAARVAFRTADEVNSRNILGEGHSEAAYIEFPGRGIAITDRVTYFQSYNLTENRVKEILKDIK